MILKGKTVKKGQVEGEAIVSRIPFSYLGDLNVETGTVAPKGHDLEGQSIAGKIFVFPTGKGSTVGPYVANRAKQLGHTPAAGGGTLPTSTTARGGIGMGRAAPTVS